VDERPSACDIAVYLLAAISFALDAFVICQSMTA